MGFHKDQCLGLFNLPCTPLHLVISSAIIIWISTFMLMIRNFIYHSSHVTQYLDRPPYHRLRPASRTSKTWMTNNLLKLNDDKTELIIVTTSETTSRQEDIVINIGDLPIAPSMEPPRNLGVLFDSTCCLNDHVNKICKNINYQLYSIGKIRKYLDKPTTEKMINSAVTSRLDYCKSLLYGINGYLVSQLQRCQNNAARIVSLRRKYDHITPVLKDLHWLPVEYRINYKILLLAYKAQHGMAPPYLSSLLSPYKPGRSLRSEGKHLLTTPRYRLEGFGKRCFAHAAPSLWNALPITIKCAQSIDIFKSNLKTHLFNIAYS